MPVIRVGDTAHIRILVLKILAQRFQHLHRLLNNLGTDAVTREYCNFLCHNVLLNFSLKGLQKRPPPYSAPPGNVFTSQGFSARRFASNSRIASTFEERVMPTSSSPFMIA